MVLRAGIALLLALIGAGSVAAEERGDPARGEIVYNKCKSCHQVGAGAKDRVGPQLNGIFGRVAGSVDGFNYSKGMVRMGSGGLVWTGESLDPYLENPKALISGTRMNFRGLTDPQDRQDVMAFLEQFSDNPADIPEAASTGTFAGLEVDLHEDILAIRGDPAYGQYLSGECTTCHQVSGTDAGIPSITGWPEEDFVVAMHAYRQKIRPHPVMQMVTSRLSDEEIAALAAYFKDLE